MNIAVFEDSSRNNFYPLSQTKTVWDLFCGTMKIHERFQTAYSSMADKIFFYCDPLFAEYYRELYPSLKINDSSPLVPGAETLFINAAAYPLPDPASLKTGEMLMYDGRPLAARLILKSPVDINLIESGIIQNSAVRRDADKLNSPRCRFSRLWDIVEINDEIISNDLRLTPGSEGGLAVHEKNVTIEGDPSLLIIEKGASVEPFVSFILTNGPVLIRSGAKIHSFSRIEGPACIGRDSIVTGARIRGGTSIGDNCRAGGEIEQTIIHGFTNKYHDGFIGHSYIGEWINMGAMTTNSDLKNNYTSVGVYTPDSGIVDTGKLKAGSYIGDYAGFSIGSLLNTGSVIGTGAMYIHSGGVSPSHIPPFAWHKNGVSFQQNNFDKFAARAAAMMNRRGRILTDANSDLLRTIFSAAEKSRQ